MADAPTKPAPPRAAVVINTKDGRRLKPSCPICGVTSWTKPRLDNKASLENQTFQTVVAAVRGEKLFALPVAMFVCQNCGFILNIAMNANREHEVGTDE
jgi:rubredoxin